MIILPLFIPHQGCPFSCIYCNQYSITSTQKETAQYFSKLISQFCAQNPRKDKEIAFFGGTFTALSQAVQLEYFDLITPCLSQIRGIRLSTRPDFIDDDILSFLKKNGVTTIELGIQSFDDQVLAAAKRGYKSAVAIQSCQKVTAAGFDLVIQLMPGLPADSRDKYLQTLQQAIELKPSGIRIYPTVVLANTTLAKWYQQEKFTPLSLDTTIEWLKISKQLCQKANVNIIKMGLHSDINPDDIIAGPYNQTIGELVNIELLFDKLCDMWKADHILNVPKNYLSLFLGHQHSLIKKIKNKLLLDKIPVCINKAGNIDKIEFRAGEAQKYW